MQNEYRALAALQSGMCANEAPVTYSSVHTKTKPLLKLLGLLLFLFAALSAAKAADSSLPPIHDGYVSAAVLLNNPLSAYRLYSRYRDFVRTHPHQGTSYNNGRNPVQDPASELNWNEFKVRREVRAREEILEKRLASDDVKEPFPGVAIEYVSTLGEYDFAKHQFPLLAHPVFTEGSCAFMAYFRWPDELLYPNQKAGIGDLDINRANEPFGIPGLQFELDKGKRYAWKINTFAGGKANWVFNLVLAEERAETLANAFSEAKRNPEVIVRVYGRFREADFFLQTDTGYPTGVRFDLSSIEIFNALKPSELLMRHEVPTAAATTINLVSRDSEPLNKNGNTARPTTTNPISSGGDEAGTGKSTQTVAVQPYPSEDGAQALVAGKWVKLPTNGAKATANLFKALGGLLGKKKPADASPDKVGEVVFNGSNEIPNIGRDGTSIVYNGTIPPPPSSMVGIGYPEAEAITTTVGADGARRAPLYKVGEGAFGFGGYRLACTVEKVSETVHVLHVLASTPVGTYAVVFGNQSYEFQVR